MSKLNSFPLFPIHLNVICLFDNDENEQQGNDDDEGSQLFNLSVKESETIDGLLITKLASRCWFGFHLSLHLPSLLALPFSSSNFKGKGLMCPNQQSLLVFIFFIHLSIHFFVFRHQRSSRCHWTRQLSSRWVIWDNLSIMLINVVLYLLISLSLPLLYFCLLLPLLFSLGGGYLHDGSIVCWLSIVCFLFLFVLFLFLIYFYFLNLAEKRLLSLSGPTFAVSVSFWICLDFNLFLRLLL